MNRTIQQSTLRKKRRRTLLTVMLLMIFLSSLIVISSVLYMEWKPSDERADIFDSMEHPIIYRGEILSQEAVVQEEQVLLPFDVFKEYIDPHAHVEEEAGTVIITTENKVIRMQNGQLEAFVNNEPFSLNLPVTKEGETWYIPYDPLKHLYPYQVAYAKSSGAVLLEPLNEPYLHGTVVPWEQAAWMFWQEEAASSPIRLEPGKKSPITADVKLNEKVRIHREENGWYFVQKENGYTGYIEKDRIKLQDIQTEKWELPEKPYVPWNPLGGKINLTWEAVYSRNPDVSQIPAMPGVNVVSPTWFELSDDQGNIKNKADLNYTKWAHDRGYQVWALFSNGFLPDQTHEVLKDPEKRMKMIRQLISYAQMYQLDGINIDFENVYLKDKQRLVQFVRELTPYLHEQDLVVSIDVTIKSRSENWSMFYDRAALAEVVDYVMVMTYDEHWGSSPVAGSVASLPWVEEGLKGVLEEVPNEKLLLGVPMYTRLWKEEKKDGKTVVSQDAYTMEGIENWLREHEVELTYDEASGQMYGEYVDEQSGATYKVWVEDEVSMEKRIALVDKYDLAGVASWSRYFAKPEIWETIEQELKERPRESE